MNSTGRPGRLNSDAGGPLCVMSRYALQAKRNA
jgi:hypothetical protein